MNIRDLRYLVAVAETNSFNQAAEDCFVSQPTLSMQIKKMEQTLGVMLIERTTRQVVMTEIGLEIVAMAKQVLLQVDNIKEHAKRAQCPLSGEFKLGIIPSIATYTLSALMKNIKKKIPQMSLRLHEQTTEILTNELLDGKLDAIILATEIDDANIAHIELTDDRFYLLVNTEHALANTKQITIEQIPMHELILLHEGHCLRDQVEELCFSAQARDKTEYLATNLETLRYMIAADSGITIMPEMALKGGFKPTRKSNLVAIPFKAPEPKRIIRIAWRKSSACTEAARAVAQCFPM